MFTYEELKKIISNRREPLYAYYQNFVIVFEDLYTVSDIQALYIRNQYNEEDIETIFFFSDKIVSIKKEGLHFRIKENKGSIISKEIFISKDPERQTELVIKFDNEEVLELDNIKDSNENMSWDYGLDIKEIYKIL